VKKRLENLLKHAGINFTEISVLGKYIHIDSFKKYSSQLEHFFSSAGFAVLKSEHGPHICGPDRYHFVAKVN